MNSILDSNAFNTFYVIETVEFRHAGTTPFPDVMRRSIGEQLKALEKEMPSILSVEDELFSRPPPQIIPLGPRSWCFSYAHRLSRAIIRLHIGCTKQHMSNLGGLELWD